MNNEYETYLNLLKEEFKGQRLYHTDWERVLEWEEVVDNYIKYHDDENIIEFVIDATDTNGSCRFIKEVSE